MPVAPAPAWPDADAARAGSMPVSPRRRDGGAIGHRSRPARSTAPLRRRWKAAGVPSDQDFPASEEMPMTVHAITAVRLEPDSQRVTHVLWGQVSVNGEQFEVAPHESPVIEVVDALARGDTVVTVFPVEGQRVAGPE